MKVVLVHGRYANSWEALGLGYLAAYVHNHEPAVKFEFFQGCFDDDSDIIAAGAKADIVAFSCTSPTFAHAVRLSAAIHEVSHRTRTVIGGYHASALPAECLAAGFDQAVQGEGEQALLDIVKGLRDPVVTGRPMDFEELPWPNRALIRNERNIGVAYRENGLRITSFQAHRGCPFSCKFCADGAAKALYGGRVVACRSRPVQDLVDEITVVAWQYKLDFFKFCDPTWNATPEWVHTFCRAKRRSAVSELPWFANIHANLVDAPMFPAMYEAGCRTIGIGIESGSIPVLKGIGKATTRETISRACLLAKRAGLHVRGYFILGAPEETEKDLEETERFAEHLDLDEYGFTILCPYPGTFYHAQDRDALGGIRWEETDEYQNDFWATRTVANARLQEWQRRLTAKFRGRLTQRQPRSEQCAKSGS